MKYASHKAIKTPMADFEPIPLREGYWWNNFNEKQEEREAKEVDSHEMHAEDCSHGHHNSGISEGRPEKTHQHSEDCNHDYQHPGKISEQFLEREVHHHQAIKNNKQSADEVIINP